MSTATHASPSPVTVYSARTTNWAALLLIVACSVPLLVVSEAPFDAYTAISVVLIVGAIIGTILTSTSFRVTIGSNGMMIRAGVFGWPRFTCRRDEIDRIEAVELSALSWGAGYWWIPHGNIRFTLQDGPAVRVYLKNGRRVTVNVDDPQAAIAALELPAA